MAPGELTPLRQAAATYERDRKELKASGRAVMDLGLLLASEDTPPPEYLLVFSHIPKTGGSTLQQVIRDNHPGAEFLHVLLPFGRHTEVKRAYRELVGSMTADERSRVIAAVGHGAGYLVDALGRPTRMITMIRDPVDRVLSWFYYTRVRRPESVRELFEVSDPRVELCNGQARIVLAPDFDTQELVKSQGPPPDADVWRIRLFGLLADRYVVGLQGAYQASLERFAKAFGWTEAEVKRSGKVNERRPRRLELDEETVELIRAYNWLDQEVYEHYSQSFPTVADPQYDVKGSTKSSRTTIRDVAHELEQVRAASRRELRALNLRLQGLERALQENRVLADRELKRQVREASAEELRELRARIKGLESLHKERSAKKNKPEAIARRQAREAARARAKLRPNN